MCYYDSVVTPYSDNGKEVFDMNEIFSFILAIAAGVMCHLICKWLDGRHNK